jgi:hypothetical protein
MPHRPFTNRQPPTPTRPRIPFAPGRDQRPCWSVGFLPLPRCSTRPSTRCSTPASSADRDGQPYRKETEYGLRSTEYRVLNRAYLMPHRPSANRQPPPARVNPSRQVGTSVPAGPCLFLSPHRFRTRYSTRFRTPTSSLVPKQFPSPKEGGRSRGTFESPRP